MDALGAVLAAILGMAFMAYCAVGMVIGITWPFWVFWQ